MASGSSLWAPPALSMPEMEGVLHLWRAVTFWLDTGAVVNKLQGASRCPPAVTRFHCCNASVCSGWLVGRPPPCFLLLLACWARTARFPSGCAGNLHGYRRWLGFSEEVSTGQHPFMSLNYLVKVKWFQPSLVTPGLHPLPSALSPAVELEALSLPSPQGPGRVERGLFHVLPGQMSTYWDLGTF